MKLRKKIFLVLAATFLLLIIIINLTSKKILLNGFNELEKYSMENNVSLVVKSINESLENMAVITADWAEWDDTYKFMDDKNQEYISANIVESTFKTLKIDLILFVDNSGRPFYYNAYNFIEKNHEELTTNTLNFLCSIGKFNENNPEKSVKGFLTANGNVILLSSKLITSTDQKSPPRGSLIFCKYLNNDIIKNIAEITNLSIQAKKIDDEFLTEDFKSAKSELVNTSQILIKEESKDTIAGYTLIRDVFGKPSLILKVATFRDISKEGVITVYYMTIAILFICFISIFIIIVFLEKIILTRLSLLSKKISDIGMSGNLSERMMIGGNDELNTLADVVNQAFENLKHSREKLIESEERYKAIIEDQTELVCRFVKGWILTFVNEAYCRFYEKTPDELIGKDFIPMIYQEDKDIIKKDVESLSPSKPSVTTEHRVLMKDNTLKWLQWTNRAIFDKNNNLIEYQSVGRDITEKRNIEDALKQSEQKFRTLAETTTSGIAIIQGNKFIYVNKASENISGFTSEEFLQMNFWDYISDEYKDIVKERGLARLEGKNIKSQYEFKIKTKFGGEKWVFANAGYMMYEGKPASVIMFFDITEQKQIEDALRESRDNLEKVKMQYQAVLRSTPNGLCILTDNWYITWSNRGMASIIEPDGMITQDMTGMHFSALFADKKEFDSFAHDARKTVRETGMFFKEISIKTMSDNFVWCDISLVRMDPAQTASGYVATIRDIAHRKKIEQDLKRAHEIYREAIENADGVPYLLNFVTGNYEFLGKGCEGLFGIPASKFNYEKMKSLVREVMITDLNAPLDVVENFKAFIGGKLKRYKSDIRIVTPIGEEKWLSDCSIPRYDEKTGKVIGSLGILQDITERKRVEDRLRLHAMVFNNIEEAVIITGNDCVIIDVNQTFKKLYEYERNEVLTKDLDVLTPHNKKGAIKNEIIPTLNRGGSWNGEFPIISKSGKLKWMQANFKPLFDGRGKRIGNIIFTFDITSRRTTEIAKETLQRISKKLTEPLDIKRIVKILAYECRKLFEHDAFTFEIYDSEQHELHGIYSEDTPAEASEPIEVPSSVLKLSKTDFRDILDRKIKLVNRINEPQDTTFARFGFAKRLSRSLMFTPVIWQENVIAVLSVQSYTPNKYSEEEIRLLQTIADHCGGAVARVLADNQLRESEERYALAVKGAKDGLWDWNLKSNKIYFSPRWRNMLGYAEKDIGDYPDEWFSIIHPEDIEQFKTDLNAHLNNLTESLENEYRIKHKDGSFRWMLVRGITVRGNDGKPYRMAGSQTDITQRKQAEEQLLHDAFHDSLTGLPNRALFLDRLGRVVERVKKHPDYLFALLFIDLDRFKVINDSLGHVLGDKLLLKISETLVNCVSATDTVARLGGDEFTILLDDIKHPKDAAHVAERILKAVSSPINLDGHEVFTTASIGIALSSADYDKPEQLLRDADTAMYSAKSKGKERFEIFNKEMHISAVATMKLETDLRMAIRRNEFELRYEPIVLIENGALIGFEALLFWKHPTEGLMQPASFISFAEETGLIIPIGEWVIDDACSQMKKWHDHFKTYEKLTVSINVSTKQLMQHNFIARIGETIKKIGIESRYVRLEMTESTIMQNISSAASILARLRALDIKIDIDDFGTGYSSLSYLHSFPVNALKIDRSFISNMLVEDESMEIVKTILTLSKNLNLHAVAEGIETVQQLEKLRELRCEFGQGYFFSKPLSAADAENLITSDKHWQGEKK